jgi:hypothetical protein
VKLTATRIAWIFLLCGLLLRVVVALQGNPIAEYTASGGDSAWYLGNGEGILSGLPNGTSRFGIPFYVEVLPIPPLYLIFVGAWQKILPPDLAIISMRLAQVAMSVGVVYAVWRIAYRIGNREKLALLPLFAMCFDPAQILEPRVLNTETLYIFLIVMGIWAYVSLVMPTDTPHHTRGILLVALCLGLATLTRAVGLMFPLAFAVHLAWVYRREWRTVLRYGVLLLGVYGVVVGTWTVYNALRYNRFVITSTQLMPAIWRGAVNNDGSPQENDALLIRPDEVDPNCTEDCKFQIPTERYVEQTADVIASNILGYIRNRLTELTSSYLQPHTTILLGGESLRTLALDWVNSGFSLEALQRLITGDSFLVKLLVYVFQFASFGLGMIGAWRSRSQFKFSGAPLAFIAYTTAIHLVLLVIPRYIFPVIPCFWMLAGGIMGTHTLKKGNS